MKRILLGAFIALQIADILTTDRFLATGLGVEANPVMAAVQASFGSLWWLPKLAVSLGCAAIIFRGRLRYAVIITALLAVTAVNNVML